MCRPAKNAHGGRKYQVQPRSATRHRPSLQRQLTSFPASIPSVGQPSQNPTEFPDLPDFASDKYHEISAGTLRELIRRTLFAAATESAR